MQGEKPGNLSISWKACVLCIPAQLTTEYESTPQFNVFWKAVTPKDACLSATLVD